MPTLKVQTTLSGGQNLRLTPQLDPNNIISSIAPNDVLIVLDDFESALSALYLQNEWLHVEKANGEQGYCAAWLLRPHSVEGLPPSSDTVAGRVRALDPTHTPVFTRLPVDAGNVKYFNGFGPNNFAYKNRSTAYRFTCRLHSGIDFGLPHDGFPLYAVDWGVVLHVSQTPAAGEKWDTPWGADFYTLIIRYGKYGAMYGHMLDPGNVSVGDIVHPGQVIGSSGSSVLPFRERNVPAPAKEPRIPHLHFEMRDLRSPIPGTESDDNDRRTALQALAPAQNQLDVETDRYLNPIRFFAPSIEDYRSIGGTWQSGATSATDTTNNGYPDRVHIDATRFREITGLTLTDTQPISFHMLYLIAYRRLGDRDFWEGSFES